MSDQLLALICLSIALVMLVPVLQRSYAYTQKMQNQRAIEEQISAAISAKHRKYLALMESEEDGSMSQHLLKQRCNKEVNELLSLRDAQLKNA